MNKSLAVEYRPHTFDDVVEQSEIVAILKNQIEADEIRGAYCFVGAAGTGKTTCARIFANEINNGQGTPIELDAASNNGVDDVREISKMAQTQPIDGSKYKVFILDEAHMFSAGAWAAMLKLIEEPPARCVFILCTTDYWKIPKTIQSRCQRYQFKRISKDGIVNRLAYILGEEYPSNIANTLSISCDRDALDYMARKSDGCLRDAITMMDKCLAYSEELTLNTVAEALGLLDLETFIALTDSLLNRDRKAVIELLEKSYDDGVDMKQFIKDYTEFVLDVNKYLISDSYEYIHIPKTDNVDDFLKSLKKGSRGDCRLDDMNDILSTLVELGTEIKWDSSPLYTTEAKLLGYMV